MAAKTREQQHEKMFKNNPANMREYLGKYKIPDQLVIELKKIRESLFKKGAIQYVGIDNVLSSTNLHDINDHFRDILRGLKEREDEYKSLVRIQLQLNRKRKVLKPNMRKFALRNSRKKREKKGGRRTRRKKRGGSKQKAIEKNAKDIKLLKLRMDRCACKEEEEEDDGYDKLSRSDFLSDIELQQPPKPTTKPYRSLSPTSVMDGPTGAAALAAGLMGGGYPQKKIQKRRPHQKGGERTPANWIKYNEILPTDRCIIPDEQGRQCNNPLMNPRSPETTAYMMNCGCVAHSQCIKNHCDDPNNPELLCPQCDNEIWESCTDVDEYLNAVRTGENNFGELPDILENPAQYWRPVRRSVRSRRPNRLGLQRRPNRTQGGSKTKKKRDRIPFDSMGGSRNRTVPEGIVVQPSDLPEAQIIPVGIVHRNPRQHMIHLAKQCKKKFNKACSTVKRIVRRELPRNVNGHRGGRKKKRKTKKKHRKRKTKKKHHKKRKWSLKYKRSINCNRPKGFSQRQYCKRIMKKKR